MPSMEVLRVRNCIHVTVMFSFRGKVQNRQSKTGVYNYIT